MTPNFSYFTTFTAHKTWTCRVSCIHVSTSKNLTEDECLDEFRFRKADIPRLSQALQIPDVISSHQGTICEGTERTVYAFEAVVLPFPIQRYGPLVR